jgi:diguanylate cyclase (GGDEF)-like protein/PAS domain S-box-containing protein
MTQQQPNEEIQRLRQRIRELEQSEADLRRAEEALRESEKRYRELVDFLPIALFEVDLQGNVIAANPAIFETFRYDYGDIEKGLNSFQMIVPEDHARMNENIVKLLKGEKKGPSEYRGIRKDGSIFPVMIFPSVIVCRGEIVGLRGAIIDLTERLRAEEALRESENRYRELSIVDDLTQLYNARHFYHQLRTEIERANRYAQPLTLLLLDLDDFKCYNDAYGHLEGDRVLARIGQVFKGCLRQADSVFRYGGEEFTILLPMTTRAEGVVTAEKIRAEIGKENFCPAADRMIRLTVSIGLAQYVPPEEMVGFVDRVDRLMYQAKKSGKDRVCCESEQGRP